MKKIIICLVSIFLFAGFVQAQKTKTMTGVVTRVGTSGNWGYIMIRVGNRKYGFEDEGNNFKLKQVGDIYKIGQLITVYYKTVDCNFKAVDDIPCWLDATKAIVVSKRQ